MNVHRYTRVLGAEISRLLENAELSPSLDYSAVYIILLA